MKRILCYGDSLTYGKIPAANFANSRYDEKTRWTSVLQKKLGEEYAVIEEGLPSRTIDQDDPTSGKEGKNGSVYLKPCLESHIPLDAIVVFLGTNDTKDFYNRSAVQIAESMDAMLQRIADILQRYSSNTQLILVAPPKIDAEKCKQYFSMALPKLERLATLYQKLAEKHNIDFVNLFEVLETPNTIDGVHLDEKDNAIIVEQIYNKIKI
jgi:lysophospholipase L1-like esterase